MASTRKTLLVLLLALAAAAVGCSFIDQSRVQTDAEDTMPWNNRAAWESAGGIGLPY